MSDISLERVDQLGDYLTDEVWEIQAVTIPQGFTGITAEDINLRALEVDIPDIPVDYIEVTHRGFTKSQPSVRKNYQSVTIKMAEATTLKTIPFLRDWMNRCSMKGTNYVYPPEQRQMEFLIYHKTNAKDTVWVYNLKNCQISTKGDTKLSDGSGPSPIQPSITLNTNNILEGPDVNNLR